MSTKNAQLAAIIDQLAALRQSLIQLTHMIEQHWNVSTGAEPKEKADAVSSRIDRERAESFERQARWRAEACERPIPYKKQAVTAPAESGQETRNER